MVSTQLWRCVSETLRADYRGKGRLSAYQIMSLLLAAYVPCIAVLLKADGVDADLNLGLRAVWSPVPLLGLQALWIAVFLHSGRSQVTASTLRFHVRTDRI
jgi:hypothetical protein